MSQLNQNADHRLVYVFKYLYESFLEAENNIKNEIQKMGIACVEDVNTQSNQDLLKSIDKVLHESLDLSSMNSEYYEDTFNLTLMSKTDTTIQQNFDKSNENVKDDVLLGIRQHLDSKLNNMLNHLKKVLELNKNQDFQVLRDRNIELTSKLKFEYQQKACLASKLIEIEKKMFDYSEELNAKKNLLDNYDEIVKENDNLKSQMKQFNVDYKNLIRQKEELEKNKMLFEKSLPDLQKTSLNISSKSYLSKSFISEELQNDVTNSKNQIGKIESEKEEFLKELSKLKIEKNELEKKNNILIQELHLQKENFEKEIEIAKRHFDDQNKFISNELEERENEIVEFNEKYNKLKEKLSLKEKKEPILLDKIKQYEEQIELINDEKHRLENQYKENLERYNYVNKQNNQLQNLLNEYEKTKEKTEQIEKELRDRLSKLEQALTNQLILNESLKKNQTEQSLSLSNTFYDHFKQFESGIDSIEQQRCLPADNESDFIINNLQPESMYHNTIDCTYSDAISLDKRNHQINNLVKDLIKKNSDLNDELIETKNMNLNLEEKILSLNNQIENLQSELKKMSLERKVLDTAINEKRSKLNSLKSKLDEKSKKENESYIKVSLENLKKKLAEEEEKVESLNQKLNETRLELMKKQNEIYEVQEEIENVRLNKIKLDQEKNILLEKNSKLNREKSRLLQELEELHAERDDEDDLDENNNLREIFETVLKHKDEEIENLNCDMNKIKSKLKEGLQQFSKFNKNSNQTCLTLLDELISLYEKSKYILNKSESYESINSLEILNNSNNKFVFEKDFENDSSDEDICDKLAGIHNNSIEICNLSQSFKNEKSLTKLINEIPEITTSDKVTKNDLENWKISFINCFSNKDIAKLLVKNIVAVRPIFFENSKNDSNVNVYKEKLKKESLKLKKLSIKNKSLVFQKKYLLSSMDPKLIEKQNKKLKKKNKLTFKVVCLAIIASLRIEKNLRKTKYFELKFEKNFDKNFQKNELFTNELEKINQFKGFNFLNPSLEKYSSFINSLNPSKNNFQTNTSANQVPLSDLKANNKASLQDLYLNLRRVNHNLGFETPTTLSSSLSP